ncbi:fluoride efflux transporter CrcB [Arthrobacter sp. B1805]|uniref:fluoride efflux transporter CrcB n=1 Tax=Arthrobacter sp. B1805 TaxID=2058892 RepID=UPI000CE45A63|nr:fluoride efflux transporter CrcB [Arthrobacter sp. B1805]
MSFAVVLALGVAGGMGSVARFMLDGAIRSRTRGPAPIGTITINISGSLLLGLVAGLVLASALPPAWTLIAGTGFLGGYTTFSTASMETARLVQTGHVRAALISGAGTAVASLAAAGLGLWVGVLLG